MLIFPSAVACDHTSPARDVFTQTSLAGKDWGISLHSGTFARHLLAILQFKYNFRTRSSKDFHFILGIDYKHQAITIEYCVNNVIKGKKLKPITKDYVYK